MNNADDAHEVADNAASGSRETTSVSWPRVRQKMERAGVTQQQLAQQSGQYQPNISAILNGREYVGARRAARMLRALRELGVDV